MSIELKLELSASDRDFIKSAENIDIHTRYGIEKAWWLSGRAVHAEFNKQVLAKDKTGRLYIRRDRAGRKRKHRASAPGQTPANMTGKYRKSFDFIVRGEHELAIGATAEYAGFLETGTSRMAKRPGLGNSIRASERDILRNLTREVEAAI